MVVRIACQIYYKILMFDGHFRSFLYIYIYTYVVFDGPPLLRKKRLFDYHPNPSEGAHSFLTVLITPINPFQNFATWNSPIHLNLSCWAPVLDFGVRWAIWLHVTSRGIPIRFCVGDLKWFNRWENKKRSSAKQVNILSKVTLHLCNLEQQYVYIYIYIQFRISWHGVDVVKLLTFLHVGVS